MSNLLDNLYLMLVVFILISYGAILLFLATLEA